MSPKTTLSLVIISLVLPMAGCTIFGKPKRCTERTPSSFATFLDEEWVEYCQEYTAHVESPANYTLGELTDFFGNHPEKVDDLKQTLYRFEKYDTCFKSPKEELQLRDLESCLQDNDETDLQITNAWVVQVDPWIDDLNYRVDAVQPKLNDLERDAKRLIKKAGEAFDFKTRLEPGPYNDFAERVGEVDAMLKAVEGAGGEFQDLVDRAAGHEALSATLSSDVSPRMDEVNADIQALRERWSTMDEARRYLEFATGSAGVRCPKGYRQARKELRLAKKMLSGENRQVGGSGVRVLGKIVEDQRGPIDVESFEGFICGIRSAENQFTGMPRLCGQYRFVIERQKGSNVDEWENWTLKSFEESGPSGGVDCSLKK